MNWAIAAASFVTFCLALVMHDWALAGSAFVATLGWLKS